MAKTILRTQRHEANKSPGEHVFVPKVGYVKVPPLQRKEYGVTTTGNCSPPLNVIEGSWHRLTIPNGATYMTFQWIGNCWVRLKPGSKRHGYPAEYLSSHGWKYSGNARNEHG